MADPSATLLRLIDEQEGALITAEEKAAQVASASLRSRITEMIAKALAAYSALGPDADVEPLLRSLRTQLLAFGVDVTDDLLSAFGGAVALGVDHANLQAVDVDEKIRVSVTVPPDVRDVAQRTNVTAKEKLIDAAQRLTGVRNVGDLVAGLSRAHMAVTAVERAARWGVNRSAATGVAATAAAAGAERLWIPERDACLHCTAYAGQTAPTGRPFAGGLTFSKKPLSRAPVPNPPLHPNCRCRIALYRPEWSRAGAVSIPDALKREARRSVARGFSLPSESESARINAAERLLRSGAGLPKTVEERARRDVERGEFRRGRSVPNGD